MAERLIRRTYYNIHNPRENAEAPEFGRVKSRDLILVKQGALVVLSDDKEFISLGFDACSALHFRGGDLITKGYWHARPTQTVDSIDRKRLYALADGEVIMTEGSKSSDKRFLLSELRNKFGIRHIDTIPIVTQTPGRKNKKFHDAYRPRTGEILVVRLSHGDISFYKGFGSSKVLNK